MLIVDAEIAYDKWGSIITIRFLFLRVLGTH